MKCKLFKSMIPLILIFTPIMQVFAQFDDALSSSPTSPKADTSQTSEKKQDSNSTLPAAKVKTPNPDEKPAESEKTVDPKPKTKAEKVLNSESEKLTSPEPDLKKDTKPQEQSDQAASIIPRKVSEKKNYKKPTSEPAKKSKNLSKNEIIKLIIKERYTSNVSNSQNLKLDLPQVSDDEVDFSISSAPDLPEKADSKNLVSTVISGLVLLIIGIFISALIFYNFKIPREYEAHVEGKYFNKKNTFHMK